MSRPSLQSLPQRVDVLVIGGGITGAGVFAEAARRGLSVLLVEQNDFASGTSSWSSKLVHGGLRYLKSGQWRLTLESVRERNRLLESEPGLVQPLEFLMPVYAGQSPGLHVLRAGLTIYGLMGGRGSRRLSPAQALALEPALNPERLLGALSYHDACTDDVGLVLRTLERARSPRAIAQHYCRVQEVLQVAGRVRGVRLEDRVDGTAREIEAGVVVDAAGVDAASLPGAPGGAPVLRPLRGSHLIFPLARLPLQRAVSWPHPQDRRPVFAYPWQGVLLMGTTDVDHAPGTPLRIDPAETAYLLTALDAQFPTARLAITDALCATSGVRPVVAGGKAAPSAESRESAIWASPGWVGVTGGKLTTFAATAKQVLTQVARELPAARVSAHADLPARAEDSNPVPESAPPTAEAPLQLDALDAALRRAPVVHLDDLLMRRWRWSLQLPDGGAAHLPELEPRVRARLGWDATRWQTECARYLRLWHEQHAIAP